MIVNNSQLDLLLKKCTDYTGSPHSLDQNGHFNSSIPRVLIFLIKFRHHKSHKSMKSKLTLRMTGLLMALTPLISFSQILDVEGSARISIMQKDNSADSVLVRLPDGILAVRDASTLTQFQVLSISHDTVYLWITLPY